MRSAGIRWLLVTLLLLSLAACSSRATQGQDSPSLQLTLAAYTTPREAYGEILPLFQAYWLERTGQAIAFEQSYLGSGAQSRAVVEGFEADVVALSLQADVARIQDAGLITHDWTQAPNAGMVSTSIVAFAVRAGNPLGIRDWADLVRPDIEVLTPNPQTSGGAMWNILALYGAARRGHVEGVPGDDPEAATAFLVEVLRHVTVMDKGARDSMVTFENGVGDVAITYENEVLVGRQAGKDYELVIPESTLLIQNPVAVVDVYAQQRGTQEAAQAFVDFLFTPEAQAVFARHGLRSVDPTVAESTAAQYPPVADLFTIEYFGGWPQASRDFFGEQGLFTQAILEAQGG
ncbi:MAG TPA: sulfate ABC transporter substrate-binding protein [Anaerolineales bacterium]|nr:sulfate ABC transporter substrate-binding protein [Anaerolineales bacterium]